MDALLKEFVANAALQAAVIGAVVWVVIAGLKKGGILPAEGADLTKRITAAVGCVLLGAAQTWLTWQASGLPPDWGKLVAAVIVAWFAAAGAHTVTKKKGATP